MDFSIIHCTLQKKRIQTSKPPNHKLNYMENYMETKPFDLYGEQSETINGAIKGSANQSQNSNSNSVLIEFDLSKNLSLFDLIKIFRDKTEELSPDAQITLYFATGNDFNCKDVNLFIDYLQTIERDFRVVLRGFVHFDFIRILFSFRDIMCESNLKIVYSRCKLHECLSQLQSNQDVFRKFITRFMDSYCKLQEGSFLDLTEIGGLGIRVQTF